MTGILDMETPTYRSCFHCYAFRSSFQCRLQLQQKGVKSM